MSHLLPFPQLAQLRSNAQLLVEQTAEHQDHLDSLVATAEWDLRRAELVASDATNAGDAYISRVLFGQVERSAAGAAMARRLSISAHEQHAAACRLQAGLDEEECVGACRTNLVLVVDDYGDVREIVARVLERSGFVVRTAANGLEGLIAAYEMRPGVIVMDVSMPVLDGIEATRLIKATAATRDARVIAYTGEASLDKNVDHRLFAAVLQKPATADAVLATVRRVASL